MKNRIIALAVAATIGLSLVSCDKYEEGPAISFKDKTERFANLWKYEYFLEDGKDVTARVDSSTFEIVNNSAFTITDNSDSIPSTVEGFWYFLDETKVIFYYAEPMLPDDRDTMEILRLKEKELWLKNITSDGKVQETRLIPNE